MHPRSFAIVLLTALVAPALVHAENLRCGSKVVQTGDPHTIVRAKCGEPTDVSRQSTLRRPTFVRNGRVFYGAEELVEVPVEVWTYNFGPNKFMRRLRFVDGILEEIQTLGYGYHDR
jgi:hypothetical protein